MSEPPLESALLRARAPLGPSSSSDSESVGSFFLQVQFECSFCVRLNVAWCCTDLDLMILLVIHHKYAELNHPSVLSALCVQLNFCTSTFINENIFVFFKLKITTLCPCLSLSFTLPDGEEAPEHTAIIAGVVVALVLLVFLTLLAVYYINTHPTVAPPIYLMQVSTNQFIHPSLLLYSLDQLII